MGFPKDEGGFYLDTDACNTAIGAVLSQFQDGQLRVIAYGLFEHRIFCPRDIDDSIL
jgi:hypothetical protein